MYFLFAMPVDRPHKIPAHQQFYISFRCAPTTVFFSERVQAVVIVVATLQTPAEGVEPSAVSGVRQMKSRGPAGWCRSTYRLDNVL